MAQPGTTRGPAFWRAASALAEKTPEERDRYVDFLRALSICAVVTGHWLVTAPWQVSGELRIEHVLAVQPWTQWLTLLFQVMPVFFFVGGYANSASWQSAQRRGTGYGAWVAGRMRRLAGPVVPLLVLWVIMAAIARAGGMESARIHEVSQLSLVPIWFLAVYILVVLLVPITRVAWDRLGMGSFWILAAAAVAVDVARFGWGHRPFYGWLNYLFIWLAVHQLGYLWRDGRINRAGRALLWAGGGAAAWAALAALGPYPISMVSVPGEEISNTLPPDIMLLALGSAQFGLFMAIGGPIRRWLAKPVPWTATVLVNSMIMSVFLWHVTAMVLLIGAGEALGGIGMGVEPGSLLWWVTRPVWLLVLALVLVVFLSLFGRFERIRGRLGEGALPVGRTLPGALMVVAALAVVSFDGIMPEGGGIRFLHVALALIGVVLLDALPLRPGGRSA